MNMTLALNAVKTLSRFNGVQRLVYGTYAFRLWAIYIVMYCIFLERWQINFDKN